MNQLRNPQSLGLRAAGLCLLLAVSQLHAAQRRFVFGDAPVPPGYTAVTSDAPYEPGKGFGYLPGLAPGQGGPGVFAVEVEEGNYDVTIRFGHEKRPTSTCIKTESRRLTVEKVDTLPGVYESRTVTVNVRKPAIAGGGIVSLNAREKGPPPVPDWDELLTIEINGKQPGVAEIDIQPSRSCLTVFIAGDSTITDQAREPYAGWGQMLPRFFRKGVAVSNQAESGLALFSFERQKRLEKVLSMMQRGDYFLIQFGHNDQKDKRPEAGPFTTYKTNLLKFIAATRQRGGIPILVTPMERRRWEGNKPQQTLSDYAQAVRQAAAEAGVPVVDLHAMSLRLYEALGPAASTNAFAFYPANAFPGQKDELKDNTHHNSYGAYQLARCVVQGLRNEVPGLAEKIAPDISPFDPSKPGDWSIFQIPPSPQEGPSVVPAGS